MKKYVILFTMVLVVIFSLFGCGNSGKEDYEAGMAALKDGDYNTAGERFEAAIAKQDDQPEYYISYGMTQVQLHGYREAANAFQKALECSGTAENEKRGWRGLGVSRYYLKEFDQAEEALRKAISYQELPDLNLECYLYLGALNDATKDVEQAYEAYNRVLEIESEHLPAIVGKYRCALDLKKESEAEELLEKGLAVSPKTAEERYMYAKLQFYDENYEGAEEELMKAAESYDEAYNLLGQIEMSRNRYEDAISYFETYLKKSGDVGNLTVCSMIGRCYMERRQYKKALEWIEKCIQMEAGDQELSTVRYNQVIVYEKLRKYKKAYQLVKKYVKIYPEDERFETERQYLKGQVSTPKASDSASGSGGSAFTNVSPAPDVGTGGGN